MSSWYVSFMNKYLCTNHSTVVVICRLPAHQHCLQNLDMGLTRAAHSQLSRDLCVKFDKNACPLISQAIGGYIGSCQLSVLHIVLSYLCRHAVQCLADVHQHPDQPAHLVLDRAHISFLHHTAHFQKPNWLSHAYHKHVTSKFCHQVSAVAYSHSSL